jgi:hypothetical protein
MSEEIPPPPAPVKKKETALSKPLQQTRLSLEQYEKVSKTLFASGLFPKDDYASILSKVLFGQALGMTPFEALLSLHAVPGKAPSLSALSIGARIKAHPRYDYRVIGKVETSCLIEWWEKSKIDGEWSKVGTSSFSVTDARAAGLTSKDNWKHYQRAMLFSRALTEGARRFAPDVFFGLPIYAPEEVGYEAEARAEAPKITAHLDEIEDASFEVIPLTAEDTSPIQGVDNARYVGEEQYQRLLAYLTQKGVSTETAKETLKVSNLREITVADMKRLIQDLV